MQEKIKLVLDNHIESVNKLNTDEAIPYLVKKLDSITFNTLNELYALKDGRKNGSYEPTEKKGHCC
jgi:ABC-type siderophore export system fused ATPase/permease subunit